MLSQLRLYATGWVAQLLMGILVLSFSVWGVNDVFNGFRSNDVARVGSSEITVTDFQRSYDLQVRNLSRQFGTAITADQARAAGVPQQVLAQLVSSATLDDAASKMGLGLSGTALGQKIIKDPQFAGSSGVFDRTYLNQLIQSQGMNEDEFVTKRRSDYVRSQIVDAFTVGATAPEAYLRAAHEYQTEERAVSYVVLTAPAATSIPEPNDTDLNTFYDAHKTEWAVPELRTVSYMLLSPAEVSQTVDVTDAEIKQRYDSQPERFATPEKRKVEQIVFKDSAEAGAAAAALAGGKTFDDLVKERNLKPTDIDLGEVTKDKIIDPKVADAAFALAQGAVSPVVEGQFGPTIVRVTAITPSVVTTFDQAKDDLKKEIANEKAIGEINTMYEAIEDARAGGSTLAEVAPKYSLKVVPLPPLDSSGKDADGNVVPNVPKGLADAAFQSDIGLENDPVRPDDSSFVWYEVTAKAEPHDRPLAEVRDKVVAAWKDSERQKKLDAQAVTVKQRLDNKEDIAKIATDLGLTVQKADKITRVTPPTGDLSPVAISDVFSGPDGAVAVAAGIAPFTKLVLVVGGVTVPPFVATAPDLTQTRTALDSQFTNDLLGLYIADLGGRTEVKYNDVALQQLFAGNNQAN